MRAEWHLASAVPFLMLGQPAAALGAVLPDLTWLPVEARYRLQGAPKPWHRWIYSVPALWIVPYRIAHSFFVPLLLWLAGFDAVAAGYLLHLLLDLPTHWGRMQQQPLYPINWYFPVRFTYGSREDD